MWTAEQYEKLLENKYAQSTAESLFFDVYPNIIFLLNQIGVKHLEFPFGKDKSAKNQFFKVSISLSQYGDSEGLIIRFNRCSKINTQSYSAISGFAENIEQIQIIGYHDFHYNPNDELVYYFHSENSETLQRIKEPVFRFFNSFPINGDFETPTHFYLHYCNNVIRLLEDLKTNYRDGFLRLDEKIGKLNFPLERKVIIEKISKNG